MAVNHVVINGETALDLRADTVARETLLSGATAHDAAGEAITGTYVPQTMTVTGTTLHLAPAAVNGTAAVIS